MELTNICQDLLDSHEKWGWVDGQEGNYEISTLGNVRSYKRSKDGNPSPIKPCLDGRGYFNFTVTINGRYHTLPIHIVSAKAFLPNPNKYKLVRHLNDNKKDNRLVNLAWGTHMDNRNDAIINGKTNQKVSDALVKFIFEAPYSNSSLANRFNLSRGMVYGIKHGKGWNRVTGAPISERKKTSTSI